MKEVMSNFFVESYVSGNATNYFSGEGLLTATCESGSVAEIGFVGRTLLNAFNALEYGEANQRAELVQNANAVIDSYLEEVSLSLGSSMSVWTITRAILVKCIVYVVSQRGFMLCCIICNMKRREGGNTPNGKSV